MKKPILKPTRKEIYEYIRNNIGPLGKRKQQTISEMIKGYSIKHNKVLLDEINILYKKLEEKNSLIRQYEAKQSLLEPEVERDLILE